MCLFKYACFISYRHGQHKLSERIITELHSSLASELELLLNEEIYLDRERLRGGDYYNESLATALCQSVCMIMVFTPTYFDARHIFCSREYKAMEALEEQRLQALRDAAVDLKGGLIIPVVFRGFDALPEEIKNKRLCIDFGKFSLRSPELSMDQEYGDKISELAEYIYDCYQKFSNLSNSGCSDCDAFALPAEEDVRRWLLENVGVGKARPAPFPNRGRRN